MIIMKEKKIVQLCRIKKYSFSCKLYFSEKKSESLLLICHLLNIYEVFYLILSSKEDNLYHRF